MSERWTIMVHGGARTIAPEAEAANRAGCLAAVETGAAVLEAGGRAIDAVVAAIEVLEDDPTFNAGAGAVRNREGDVELDAAIMDGETLDVGAVAALRGYANPIHVAKALLRDEAVLLVGAGAAAFAAAIGAAPSPSRADTVAPALAASSCDTVGCVAYDRHGALASGLSTGGLEGVRAGRVGDTPVPGAGFYAEGAVGAAAFSGDGEAILRLALAGRLMRTLPQQGAAQSAALAVAQMGRVGGEAGCIVLDASGTPAFAHNSAHFAVACAREGETPRSYLRQDEIRP
jgi:L-asparaginase / beta-aspartyl-peptidase